MRLDGDHIVVPFGRLPPEYVREQIPGSEIAGSEVRFPWTIRNTIAASDMELSCISPMPRDYSFPGKFKPRDYQIQGADFLARNRAAYMFLPAGTGKTLTALWAANYLMEQGIISRVLVVSTKSTLISAWESTISAHFRHLSCGVISGSMKTGAAKTRTPIHIINHDGIHYLMAVLSKNKYDMIIYDESTAIGNDGSQRAKAALRLRRPGTWLWQMTATPIPQSPENAHGQIRLMQNVNSAGERILPGRPFGIQLTSFMSRESWRNLTMRQVSAYRWEPKEDANDIVFRYMQPAFRRDKRQILPELPPVSFAHFELDMTPEQKRAVKDLREEQVHRVNADTIVSAVNAGVLLSKIIQIATGIAYAEPLLAGQDEGGERPVKRFSTAAKDQQMLEIIKQASAKALVYVPFRAALGPIAEFLRKHGYKVEVLQGSVSPKGVAQVIDAFQAGTGADVIVAIPQKMSHGITATAADTIIWYSPVLRAEIYQQANERTDRIGQKNPTTIAHLYACSTEEQLYRRLENRTLTQNAFLDMYSSFLRNAD